MNNNPSLPDLKALPVDQAKSYVQEHYGNTLRSWYQKWKQSDGMIDFDDLRKAAVRDCPGMSMLWCTPFVAVFPAQDGAVLVRFAGSGDHPLSTVETRTAPA